MFELNVKYEELEKKIEEVKGELVLIRNGIILAKFDADACVTDIEAKGCEIARKTLRCEDIDLYVFPEKKLLLKDIMKEEIEHYQVINESVYTLDDEEEVKEELEKYAENIFTDMLYRSDAYFELCYNADVCNNCIYYIYKQMKKLYNEGYTIYTSDNSFMLYGSYENVMSTRFENYRVVLNKTTKKNIISEVKRSGLSEAAKKEVISRIKTY